MKKSKNQSLSELKLGITIIVALVLGTLGIMKMGADGGLFANRYTLLLNMENTYGLKIGGPVRLVGLTIGSIEDITFPDDIDNRRIIVQMSIAKKYQDRIREDSVVSINSMGLLGDKFVEISVGSKASRILGDGDTLTGMPDSAMKNVIAGATSGIEGLNIVMGQLKEILSDVSDGNGTVGHLVKDPILYENLHEAIKNIKTVSEDLHDSKGALGKLIHEPELYDNLVDVSVKANLLADNLNNGNLGKLSSDEQFGTDVKELAANLNALSTDARSFMKNLESGTVARLSDNKDLYARIDRISANLDKLMEDVGAENGTVGKLLNDKELYDNMNKFFKDADALVVDLKENPDRYVQVSVF